MTTLARCITALCALVLQLAVCTVAHAQDYTITEIPTLGGPWSSAQGISNSGYVVGSSETGRCYHCTAAFVYRRGKLIEVETLTGSHQATAHGVNDQGYAVGISNVGALIYRNGQVTSIIGMSEAEAINDAGIIVGSLRVESGEWHAARWEAGIVQDLGTLTGTLSRATDVNAAGDIVGDWGTGNTHGGFLYTNGKMHDIGWLVGGGGLTYARAINDKRQIVGWSGDSGFIYEDGKMTALPNWFYPQDINNSGEIVGNSSTGRAVLYREGKLFYLDDLIPQGSGWVLINANGINASGDIVGVGTLNGESRGFLLRR